MKTHAETFDRILTLGREDGKDIGGMGLKLMEEVGEFAECLNFELGNLPHKTLKEPTIAEAADVIQNVVCILAKVYGLKMTNGMITAELFRYLESKTDKWESVMMRKAP